MDAQNFRSFQEAYREVYQQLDELSDKKVAAVGRARAKNVKKSYDMYLNNPQDSRADTQRLATSLSKENRFKRLSAKREKRTQQEQTDLYDIILSHLLDEGYAETPEAAEVIMVNMSEDWMQSIVEELEQLDEISKELEGRVEMERIARTGAAADRALMHRNPQATRAAEDAAEKERRTRSLLTKRRRKRARMG